MKKPARTNKSTFVVTSMALLLASACSTPQGYFGFEATDSQGKPINTGMVLTADGRGIYTALSAFCSAYRGATVVIRNVKTNEELKPQSPHRCK